MAFEEFCKFMLIMYLLIPVQYSKLRGTYLLDRRVKNKSTMKDPHEGGISPAAETQHRQDDIELSAPFVHSQFTT